MTLTADAEMLIQRLMVELRLDRLEVASIDIHFDPHDVPKVNAKLRPIERRAGLERRTASRDGERRQV